MLGIQHGGTDVRWAAGAGRSGPTLALRSDVHGLTGRLRGSVVHDLRGVRWVRTSQRG
jgi:hypothetical protein